MIYGAGRNGRTLAQRFSTDNEMGFIVAGFVDDDPQKVGRYIGGIKVLGRRTALRNIILELGIKELIISTKLSGDSMREVLQVARSSGIRPRVLTEISSEKSNFDLFRNVELGDLLNRPPAQVDFASLSALIRDKVVLLTGAGGSIGSELARQILKFKPKRLLLLDHSEFNLYEIDKELNLSLGNQGVCVPLLIDLKDVNSLRGVTRKYVPDIVFHAAAYKHVHLVESNPIPAILNNILGTKNLLDLCREIDVETFVLISTDKAVNPVGIMGATKRACELMIAQAGLETGERYCAVRFGNVLGSSGSLIPLLQKQIENGEPVTITHPDMTRYFMLIPEAVSLVLKAATIAKPGDITILDMGKPIKIVDIAKSLIALANRERQQEIPFVFTGVRPGEKMFEELYLCGNELNTEHPSIFVLPKGDTPIVAQGGETESTMQRLVRIIRMAQDGNLEAIDELRQLVALCSRQQSPGAEVAEGWLEAWALAWVYPRHYSLIATAIQFINGPWATHLISI